MVSPFIVSAVLLSHRPLLSVAQPSPSISESSCRHGIYVTVVNAQPHSNHYPHTMPAIADDSGLCVDYLDGYPGIYSARFANIEIHGGECVDNERNADDEDNNNLLLKKLEGVEKEKRTAYYVCAICCIFPDGKEITVRGECHGHIGFERDGNAGFGYDPLFIINGKSFGKYEGEEKDKISHRGKALRLLAKELEKII